MKTMESMNLGISKKHNPSRGNSCFLAMQQLFPRVLAIFMLLLVSGGAWAADYVFVHTDGWIFGQSTTASKDFIPNECIYTGSSGNTFKNANGIVIIMD